MHAVHEGQARRGLQAQDGRLGRLGGAALGPPPGGQGYGLDARAI